MYCAPTRSAQQRILSPLGMFLLRLEPGRRKPGDNLGLRVWTASPTSLRQDNHGYQRFSGFRTPPSRYRSTGRHALPCNLPIRVPTAEKVKPSLVRGNTGSEADREVPCHMYLWMYNQETGHFPHFSRHLYRNLLVHLSVGVVFGPHGPPPPFFTFVEIPALSSVSCPTFNRPALLSSRHSLARLIFPPDMFTESRVTNNSSSARSQREIRRPRGVVPRSHDAASPPVALIDDAGVLPSCRLAVSRLPLPVFRLVSCIMQSAATFADEDQEGSPKSGQHLSDHQTMSKFIDQELPHWADYRRHPVSRPPSLRVSSHPPIHHTQRSNRQPPLLAQGEVRKEHSPNPRSRPYCCASDTVQRTGKPAASIAARLSRLDGLTLCDRHFCPVCPLARLLCTGPRLSTARVA